MKPKSLKDLHEESLDPQDWEATRKLGHKMVDDMVHYLKTVRKRPVWQKIPQQIKSQFNLPVPTGPEPTEEIFQEFLKKVLPYPMGNIHPRFWGWILGTGTITGAYAELLAATMNTNNGGGNQIGNHVEKQVIDWIKEMLEFPASASGVLTSGCSASNLIGLTVARNIKSTVDLRRKGLQPATERMVLYASEEAHSSIQKAIELLGLGNEALRFIPVNSHFQINIDKLNEAIIKDRHEGFSPFCVVGAAGTTNTGSVDDLKSLSSLCKREKLWFHIDGAFGAWARLTSKAKGTVAGLELADSLALDLHKWMYMPYEIGCVLVREEKHHRRAFSLTADYLAHGEGERGVTGGDLPWFSDYSYELSRGFRALKAWMSIKEHGSKKYARIIQQNIDQAAYLGKLIQASPDLKLCAPITLNIVCFRFISARLDDSSLDEVNKKIAIELQERGIAVLTGTVIDGRYVLRVANTNHRSRREDFEILVTEVVCTGEKLVRNLQS
ncbi:MAG TPA: aminotransferase class V-fold PLP-dependent enzyme [Candidatus Binatia bacterium]|nr:aminotransferase class V-fold PLP-dependent enzyme [Candidatus Binatia bacterium]